VQGGVNLSAVLREKCAWYTFPLLPYAKNSTLEIVLSKPFPQRSREGFLTLILYDLKWLFLAQMHA
jgi:hypothetical protein